MNKIFRINAYYLWLMLIPCQAFCCAMPEQQEHKACSQIHTPSAQSKKSHSSAKSTEQKRVQIQKLLAAHGLIAADDNYSGFESVESYSCDQGSLNERLFQATAAGNPAEVTLLIQNGANVNSRNFDGETPLHCAVKNNRETIMHILLDNGASVNVADKNGTTPLHLVSMFGSTAIRKTLLMNHANPLAKDIAGETPLDKAKKLGDKSFAKLVKAYTALNKSYIQQ